MNLSNGISLLFYLAGISHNWVVLQKYYYTLFHLTFCMKEIALWVLLGIFFVSGILMKGQQSEATDYSSFTIPTNNTSTLTEEEKEEDEINATTPTNIQKEQFVNASNKQ